jgi:hypothetical protein
VEASTAVHATAAADYTAGDTVCSVHIPSMDNGHYQIETFEYSTVTPDAGSLASRFLATATFGANKDEISAFQSTYGNSAEAWITSQINEPATLHREFFRRRANKRFPKKLFHESGDTETDDLGDNLITASQGHIHAAASPLVACSPGSRWSRFAFTMSDIDKAFVKADLRKDVRAFEHS